MNDSPQENSKFSEDDFLSFSKDTQRFNTFKPHYVSSPNKQWRPPRQHGRGRSFSRPYFMETDSDSSYNSPGNGGYPRNQHSFNSPHYSDNRGHKRRSFANKSGSHDSSSMMFASDDSFSIDTSPNISGRWNASRHDSSYGKFSKKNAFSRKGDDEDLSNYLHPSFMENPWAQLEKKLAANDCEKKEKESVLTMQTEDEETN